MTKLYERLVKLHDSLEGKLVGLTLGIVATTVIASDLPGAFSTNNYKLAVCEIGLATYFGITTYLEGKKISKEYKK